MSSSGHESHLMLFLVGGISRKLEREDTLSTSYTMSRILDTFCSHYQLDCLVTTVMPIFQLRYVMLREAKHHI